MKPPACVRENVPLSSLTTFRLGGPARWLAEPATREEVREVFAFARGRGLPVGLLGGGSNLLAADAGVEAVALRLSSAGEFGAMIRQPDDSALWRVGAAVGLGALVGATVRVGVAGLETWAGIPGTVGGAAFMNAGGSGEGIGRVIRAAEIIEPDGRERRLEAEELAFGYRRSALSGCWAGCAAIAVEFSLPDRGEPETLLNGMRACRERKAASQPLEWPSAGCVFRNPAGQSAGALLDRAGCKGLREGGAEVSDRHANFIINRGGATARDVAVLAGRMRRMAAEAFGIFLTPEITLWGEESAFEALRGDMYTVRDVKS